MTAPRTITRDDLKSLAIGVGILGTGGGTHPYLEFLNLEKLYQDGHTTALLSPDELGPDDLVAEVGFMGAPLVSKERLPDPEQILRPFHTMQEMTGQRFRAVMTSEIGGENGLLPFLVAALAGIPVLEQKLRDARVDLPPRG